MQVPIDGSRPPLSVIRANGRIKGDGPVLAPDGSMIAFLYDAGQIPGSQGPDTEWRIAVHPLLDTVGSNWTITQPAGRIRWAGADTAVLYATGVGIGVSPTLHMRMLADGTDRAIAVLPGGGAGGYAWHA
jgi:hypothetical protein